MDIESINIRPSDQISLKEFIQKIREWIKYLFSKWGLIFVFVLFGAICGYTYAKIKDLTYTATTTFVLENGDGGRGMGQYAGIASMVGIDVGGSGGGLFQGDNIIELYKSRTIIKKTLLSRVDYEGKSKLLIDVYIDFKKLREKWAKNENLKNLNFDSYVRSNKIVNTRLQDSVLSGIANDIATKYLVVSKPDKKLSIIRVDVKAKNEFFAKCFNDQIVKNVNDFYILTKTKKSVENITIMQKKTDSVRRVMTGAIYKAAEISDATPNLNPTRQVQRVAPVQQSQFSAETNRSILGELLKNLEMSKISLLKEMPLIQTIDQPVYPLENDKLSKAIAITIGAFVSGFAMITLLLLRKILSDLK